MTQKLLNLMIIQVEAFFINHYYISSIDISQFFKNKKGSAENMLSIFVVLALSIIASLLLSFIVNTQKDRLELFMIGILVFFMIGGFFWINFFEMLQCIVSKLHNKLPHPENRIITLFFKLKLNKITNNGEIDSNIVIDEIKTLSKKTFFKKYFDKDSTNFINFMEERMKYDSKFINYALSIPKKKELSIDALRKILIAYPDSLQLKGILNLDKAFENYTVVDIEKIFTQVGTKAILTDIKPNIILPIAVHFSELTLRDIPDYVKVFDSSSIDGFNFSILRNKVMYDKTSDEFKNCVRGRYTNPNTLILAERNGLKTCIEISTSKNIVQMAGPRDSMSPDRHELSKIFKSKGFKVKFTLPHIF